MAHSHRKHPHISFLVRALLVCALFVQSTQLNLFLRVILASSSSQDEQQQQPHGQVDSVDGGVLVVDQPLNHSASNLDENLSFAEETKAGNHIASPVWGQERVWLFRTERSPTNYRYPISRFATLNHQAIGNERSLVVGVLSVGHLSDRRDWIRQTWARNHSNVIFLVAGEWNRELEQEMELHQDLLWTDTPESYRGITIKVVTWYAAVHRHLSNVQYVMKTDDDSYLRLYDIVEDLLPPNQNRLYLGTPCTGKVEVRRDPQNKWFVPKENYAPDYFPPYAYGQGYILSQDLVACFVSRSHFLEPSLPDVLDHDLPPLLPIEDAYIGILVQQCGGQCRNDDRFAKDSKSKMIWNGISEGKARQYHEKVLIHKVNTEKRMQKRHGETCCRSPEMWSQDPTCATTVSQSSCEWESTFWATYFSLPRQDGRTRCLFPPFRFESIQTRAAKRQQDGESVVAVLSTGSRSEQRNLIRQMHASNPSSNLFFVVAGDWTPELELEMKTHQDLLWIDVNENDPGIRDAKVAAWHIAAKQYLSNVREIKLSVPSSPPR